MMIESTEPEMDERSIEERKQTIVLQKLLALGNTEIEQGKFRDAEDVFAELDKRITEDDSTPHDTVTWERIHEDALVRWQR